MRLRGNVQRVISKWSTKACSAFGSALVPYMPLAHAAVERSKKQTSGLRDNAAWCTSHSQSVCRQRTDP